MFKKYKRALIIPDTHLPMEDERAYNLMLSVAKHINPEEIVILGDYADFYSISAHGGKDPTLANLLEKEIAAVNFRLDELDKLFPKANKIYIQGNHEYRLERYLKDKAPELFGLFSCVDLFRLNRRKRWTWIPYGPEQKYQILNSKLFAKHEPIGPNSKTTAQRAMASVVFGHIHSICEDQVVALDGTNYRAISIGWLGDKKHEAFSYVKNHAQWALGFGVAHVLKNGTFFHQTVHIIDYQCMYGGKLFK